MPVGTYEDLRDGRIKIHPFSHFFLNRPLIEGPPKPKDPPPPPPVDVSTAVQKLFLEVTNNHSSTH